jgi:hypothetical protein
MRTLLKVLVLVGLVVVAAWFAVGKQIVSRGKANVGRSGTERAAEEAGAE